MPGGSFPEPFGNGETSLSRTPQKIISCHWQQKKVPQFSPVVWEDDVGVAKDHHPTRSGQGGNGTMEIFGLCCKTEPFAQPRARLSGCLLLAWGTLASLSSPAQPVTQRSCSVLCRALSFPDLLPPSHGPSKTSLAQWPRVVVGAGALSTALSWALVSRSDVAQWKRERSCPSLHNHRHTWSPETSMDVMCWLPTSFPVHAPCSSSHWDFATF